MANYTYTTSKANFDPTTWRRGTARLQRTTPNEFNLKLTHDGGRVSPRGAVTYNAAAIRAYQYADGHPGVRTDPTAIPTLSEPQTKRGADRQWSLYLDQ